MQLAGERTVLGDFDPRFAYVYARALNSYGFREAAAAVLEEARVAFPDDSEIRSFRMLLNQ